MNQDPALAMLATPGGTGRDTHTRQASGMVRGWMERLPSRHTGHPDVVEHDEARAIARQGAHRQRQERRRGGECSPRPIGWDFGGRWGFWVSVAGSCRNDLGSMAGHNTTRRPAAGEEGGKARRRGVLTVGRGDGR
jgi:hypothetical protein